MNRKPTAADMKSAPNTSPAGDGVPRLRAQVAVDTAPAIPLDA